MSQRVLQGIWNECIDQARVAAQVVAVALFFVAPIFGGVAVAAKGSNGSPAMILDGVLGHFDRH